MAERLEEKDVQRIIESCQTFVNHNIRPFDPEKDDEVDVYVQLIWENDDIEENLTFDVYTKSFINRLYDYDLSPRAEHLFTPHLFSYQFISDKTKDDLGIYNYIRELAERNNGWINAKLKRSEDASGELCILGRTILRCGNTHTVNAVLEVNAAYSATDQDRISHAIHFVENNTNGINEELPHEAGAEGSGVNPDYLVNVYKVGNANAALIENRQNSNQMIVDCGIDPYDFHAYTAAQTEIQSINPEYIVISHNHRDHFNLLFNQISLQGLVLNISTCALKWIIMAKEGINGTSYFSESLLKNYFQRKLHLVTSISQTGKYFLHDFPNMYLFSGICKNMNQCAVPCQSYLENDKGLILVIKNKKTVIFAGDCSYDFFPSGIHIEDADYIVIPHHGGKVMMAVQRKMTGKPNPVAIISSKYTQFYPSNANGYSKQFDQDIFLNGIGITNREFLQSLNIAYKYTFLA